VNGIEEITSEGSGMAFLRQEARVVERFQIVEAAQARREFPAGKQVALVANESARTGGPVQMTLV
jgi:hypothetical protein